jgi:hypothetical protein
MSRFCMSTIFSKNRSKIPIYGNRISNPLFNCAISVDLHLLISREQQINNKNTQYTP